MIKAASSLLFVAICVSGCGGDRPAEQLLLEGPDSLARLTVRVNAPVEADSLLAHRSFFMADGSGAFFYDAAAGPADDPAMGFTIGTTRVLESWNWWVEDDSTSLGPADRDRADVRPDFVLRSYVKRDSSGFFGRLLNRIGGKTSAAISERVTLMDGRRALLVEVPDSIGAVVFRPHYPATATGATEVRGAALMMSSTVGLDTLWTAIRAEDGTTAADGVRFSSPGRVVVAGGWSWAEADSLARATLRDAPRLRTERSARLAALLERSAIETENEEVNRALAWARISFDALLLRDTTETLLLPGIPGAEPVAGRSILQNMNALLAIGEWETARRLLTTYGRAQLFDERLDRLGRAPNIVRPGGQTEFVTADATPIYLAAAGDYVRTSGDRGLVSGAANFWFKTVFAMRGLYQESSRHPKQVSEQGFLRAADGETWMQSRSARPSLGTARSGSPVEAQGSLYRALGTASSFAGIMGVARREGTSWYADSAAALLQSFSTHFVSDGALLDRIGPAGEAIASDLPNGILALRDIELPPDQRAALARRIAERMAYSDGLSTRIQSDSLFHPYVSQPSSYSAVDALYNGPIWTWLSGPLVAVMAATGGKEAAAELFSRQCAFVEGFGVIGAITENVDAHPRSRGENPIAGGTPLQPWSLGEVLRNAYEDFAGISYAAADTVEIEPRIPESWGKTVVRFRMGAGSVQLEIEQNDDATTMEIMAEPGIPPNAVLRVRAQGMEVIVPLPQDSLPTRDANITIEMTGESVTLNGDRAMYVSGGPTPDPGWWQGFSWLEPIIPDQYPVMQTDSGRRLLAVSEMLRDNPAARLILTQTDPDGDDWGSTSTYTYPPDIPPSILDATYLEVAEDDSTTYFRVEFVALERPESSASAQTFVAIALNTAPGGTNHVGRNALYDFPRDEGYEIVIFVGDGIVVEDARGRVLAEVPVGAGSAFDESTASLLFALPRFVLPDLPRNSLVTLLVGAREETGDVGAFRRVSRTATGSTGGGKVDPRDPNVYDVVSDRVVR